MPAMIQISYLIVRFMQGYPGCSYSQIGVVKTPECPSELKYILSGAHGGIHVFTSQEWVHPIETIDSCIFILKTRYSFLARFLASNWNHYV